MDSMPVFETVGPGSIPGRVAWHFMMLIQLLSECAGFARDSTEVEDQVQFLAGAFSFPQGLKHELRTR